MLTYKYVLLSPFGFPFDTKKNHKVCREPPNHHIVLIQQVKMEELAKIQFGDQKLQQQMVSERERHEQEVKDLTGAVNSLRVRDYLH
jgi:hypothetical protein